MFANDVFSKVRIVFGSCLSFLALLVFALVSTQGAFAQQTLGGILGTVTDASGSVMQGVTVKVVQDGTNLTRTALSSANGSYALPDLPIGTYTVTFTHEGFDTAKFPGIVVQADRTVTLPTQLTVGAVATSVTVEATPLLNAVDTTNGYVVDKQQIQETPLPTGSFTGLAILSPGVNAELPGGTGVNSGLGNAPIWANGQRDTSNSFLLNGVDGSNLFNGKSTSQVGSARVVNSTGVGNSGGGGVVQSSASVYLSIGNAIPTPAPETIEEIRVNTSMYSADQGSTSGAHIDLATSSGTNAYHGNAYFRRGTNFLNAAPFFFKQDGNVPAAYKNPQLHRYTAGGTFGGPIIKDKLFGFVAYQHLHVSDQEIGDSFLQVPFGLSDTNRNADGIANISNNSYCTTADQQAAIAAGETPCTQLTGANIDKGVVLPLFNSPALKGETGKWLIPNDNGQLSASHPANAFIPGTAYFIADQAVADVDYNATTKDTLALKYYFQHDPTVAPFAYSNVPGFAQHLDAGSHVFALNNTYLIRPNLSTQETVGFLREKIYSTNEQAFGPSSIPGGDYGTGSINTFGSNYFPGVSIINVLGENANTLGVSTGSLSIGPNAEAQGSNTGVFQNRIQPSANALWTLGRHTLSFGGSYSYTQLNTVDKRTGTGTIAADDFSQFVQGSITPGGSFSSFYVSSFLQGNATRYYRANQLGLYFQDKFQILPTLSISAGLRYDWDGGLTEKNGRLFNFEPSLYNYSDASDTINNSGLIIAGNNAQGTRGVSNTTLTGRQWGIAYRLGTAWQPTYFKDKVVVRAGTGIYYDRGELFSYLSPGYAIGTVTGGPFGVNQQLPFVTTQTCAPTSYYLGYIPTCGPGSIQNPWGTTLSPAPTNPKASDLANYLPNAAAIQNFGQPISLGVYDRQNKLPYSINYTLDVQWQPRNDLSIELGYVGNLSRHQVVPVPFNQPGIASPSNPIHGQNYTYGYTVTDQTLPDGSNYQTNYEGGNVDLRVPYIGYAAESIDYKTAGVSAYNAFQAHIEKRMTHGLQVAASYTYSHAIDDQSGLGLFYTGNDPNNLASGYGSSDFDRTHVINFNYVYRLPDFYSKSTFPGYFADGWSFVGLTVLQSGQPYSVVDYSGAVGSIYYSTADGITNPIVPLAAGCTPKNAKTGASGAFGTPALKNACFTVPLLAAGGLGGAIPTTDPYENGFTSGQRNIFRQSFQKRADISLIKMTNFKERYNLKYTFDVFNLTNTTSFDIPNVDITQNQNFNSFITSALTPTPLPTTCDSSNKGFYNCPFGLGLTTHAIGSSRQIQMSLGLTF